MRRDGSSLTFSPTDLYRFVESRFAAWMDRFAAEHPDRIKIEPRGEEVEMILRRGREHEEAYIELLVEEGKALFDPHQEKDPFAATLEAMRRGEPLIQQAALSCPPFRGYADLLVRSEGRSDLGGHYYIPRDVKLGRNEKPKYIIQLCAYIEMLEAMQGRRPEYFELFLGDNRLVKLRTVDYFDYYLDQRGAFLEFQEAFDVEADLDSDSRPVPEMGSNHGDWDEEARSYLEEIDHLSRVANIRKTQVGRLEAAGINTMTALAETEAERIPKLNRRVFERLRRQAQLQLESRGLDRPRYEVIENDPEGPARGLARLPPSAKNDLFFDMEGYPLVEDGLEYLFGASYFKGKKLEFKDWWAHTREEEKLALEGFIDWAHRRWQADKQMHIYHYAPYEITALNRLAAYHATCEEKLDRLLRHQVFVDLYSVVRHGLLVGEPRYSIKNLERLFREHREGGVQDAFGSIVAYEQYLDSDEPGDWKRSPRLKEIREYNRDDCESTAHLADWLRRRQGEQGIEFRGKVNAADDDDKEADPFALDPTPDPRETEENLRRRALAEKLLDSDDPIGPLLGQLVEFHRREEKPRWWDVFRRQELTDDELAEDLACLGRLQRIEGSEHDIKRSLGIRYRFDPDQDTKLDEGDKFFLSHDLELKGEIETIDRDEGVVTLRFGPSVMATDGWPPPARISLIPSVQVKTEPLAQAIEKTAERWLESGDLPAALNDFLTRQPPRIMGIAHGGSSIIREDETPSDGCLRVIPRMRGTTLSIQGPPGTGKTYTAARTILDLLSRGRRVGITSNSHKAILNLLVKCEEVSLDQVRCLKVSGDEDDPLLEQIPGAVWAQGGRNALSLSPQFPLIGATAWHFARPEMKETLDYLFVDEAGQVSVANLVATAGSAQNLVLMGDQMQLGQPTQAQHPGESGASTLQYLLRGERTIPADAGVFLDVTYRLHPDICRLSSDLFYEGRLQAAEGIENREILLDGDPDDRLPRGFGVVFIPVEHEGNTQGSDEEVEVVRQLYDELLGLEQTDVDGEVVGVLGVEQILVVAPYNMQVRKLAGALPSDARVGTVDKFQGQEAPVVIVSMCASEAHDSPRGIQFLLNPNRLNVALSRAESLAIVVGHPGLARGRSRTADEMRLLNLYSRIVG